MPKRSRPRSTVHRSPPPHSPAPTLSVSSNYVPYQARVPGYSPVSVVTSLPIFNIMGSRAPRDDTDGAVNPIESNAPALLESVSGLVAETLGDAAGPVIPIAEIRGGEGDEEHASDYWDASSMAPLNAASAVSIPSSGCHRPLIM